MAENRKPPPPPVIPLPSGEYSQVYMDRLARVISDLVYRLYSQTDWVWNSLTLTGIPSSPTGLFPGDLYHDGGVVKVVLENSVYPPSVSATGQVGTLTVSIT